MNEFLKRYGSQLMFSYECQIFFFRTLGRKCETNPWQEIFIIFSAHIKDKYLLFVFSRVFFLYTLKQYFAITDRDRCNLCDTCKIYRKHV